MDDNETLKREIEALKKENASLKKENTSLNAILVKEKDKAQKEIDKIKLELDKALGETHQYLLALEEVRKLIEKKDFQYYREILNQYGIKSERSDVLVNEPEVIMDSSSKEEIKAADKLVNKIRKDKPGRKKGTRNFTNIDEDRIERETIYLNDEVLTCPECGNPLIEDGNKETVKVEYTPSKIKIVTYVQRKYACSFCNYESEKRPIDVFNDNLASPSFVAYIANLKYNYALPLYRQEDIFKQLGFPLSRISLSKYLIAAGDILRPLYTLLIQKLVDNPVKIIHADETTFKVIDECKDGRAKNYVYVYTTSEYSLPIYVYSYSKTRANENPRTLLERYKGYLICDGYQGYDSLPSDIKLARCWVHVRRKYADIVKTLSSKQKENSLAFKYVKTINKLFSIEGKCREKKLTPNEILEVRKEKSLPIVDNYFISIKELAKSTSGPLLDAINYSLSLENDLRTFLIDGTVPLDNNLAERTIKSFVIMRKNALFAYSKGGAEPSYILMSIIQTAKANCLDPEAYLRYILEKMNTITTSQLPSLLPTSDALPKDLKVKIKKTRKGN